MPVDLPEVGSQLDFKLTKFFESRVCKLIPDISSSNTIWLKPNFNAPFGFALWVASQVRNIQIVSQQEYLISQRKFQTKTYTCDFPPLKVTKNHTFAKYEFKVTSKQSRINLRIKCPADPYLIQFTRLKIIDKSKSTWQIEGHSTQHLLQLDNLKFDPTD